MARPSVVLNKEELEKLISESDCFRMVCRKLGKNSGSFSNILKRECKKYNIDTTHFIKYRIPEPKRLNLDDILNNKVKCYSSKLKPKLINAGFFEEKCYRCNNIEWLNGKIPLELEHIDGNPLNNNLSNLTLLCPNCHALTSTYRGRNKKDVIIKIRG